MIYKLALVFHLVGLILLAGSTFFSFISFQKISKSNDISGNTITNNISIANLGFGLGMALLVLSGITFIVMANAFASQIWFKVKMGAMVLIIINNVAMGRPAMKKLISSSNGSNETIFQRLSIYYYIQFFILLAILVLSTFKFV